MRLLISTGQLLIWIFNFSEGNISNFALNFQNAIAKNQKGLNPTSQDVLSFNQMIQAQQRSK